MNKYVIIKVTDNINRFINKCNKNNIELYKIIYNDKYIIVKINKKDYELIKRYNYYCNIETYDYVGLDKIKNNILNNNYFIISFFLCIIMMFLSSNIIIDINIIHSNKKVREQVEEELYNYGIKKYSFKKQFEDLEIIKNKVLKNNKETIEWISITNVGMKYIVRVEERIIRKFESTKEYCNIISTKEAIISNIYSTNGEVITSTNDLVRNGDILVSGNILLNEEIKEYTCAEAIVLGKVWYKTNISLKRKYYRKEYTGNKRYNFTINNKVLRNNKYNKYDKKYLINTKYFKLYKELEYNNKTYYYSEKESLKKALLELDKKISIKLKNKGKILSKKVLSKNINNTSISIEVFVETEEVISKQTILSIPKEE